MGKYLLNGVLQRQGDCSNFEFVVTTPKLNMGKISSERFFVMREREREIGIGIGIDSEWRKYLSKGIL